MPYLPRQIQFNVVDLLTMNMVSAAPFFSVFFCFSLLLHFGMELVCDWLVLAELCLVEIILLDRWNEMRKKHIQRSLHLPIAAMICSMAADRVCVFRKEICFVRLVLNLHCIYATSNKLEPFIYGFWCKLAIILRKFSWFICQWWCCCHGRW